MASSDSERTAAPDPGPGARARQTPGIDLIATNPSRLKVTRKSQGGGSPAARAPEPADRSSAPAAPVPGAGQLAGGSRQAHADDDGLVLLTVPAERLHPCRSRRRKPYRQTAIEALAASIRTTGWHQPILVRPHPAIAGHYEVVVGDLPFRAARSAGLARLPVAVCNLSDLRALECILLEEARRPDLAPVEAALVLGQLLASFDYSLAELAGRVGTSEREVVRRLLLLGGPAASRDAPASGLSALDPASPNAELAALERRLSDRLGLKVEVATCGWAGTVRIAFEDIEQLEQIARHLSSFGTRSDLGRRTPGLAA